MHVMVNVPVTRVERTAVVHVDPAAAPDAVRALAGELLPVPGCCRRVGLEVSRPEPGKVVFTAVDEPHPTMGRMASGSGLAQMVRG